MEYKYIKSSPKKKSALTRRLLRATFIGVGIFALGLAVFAPHDVVADSIAKIFVGTPEGSEFGTAKNYTKQDEELETGQGENVAGLLDESEVSNYSEEKEQEVVKTEEEPVSEENIHPLPDPPLIVPTSGIAARADLVFLGPESSHPAIDIFTNADGKGLDGKYYKGNPIYSACAGYVRNIRPENGDVSIICDELDEKYRARVLSLKVKTLYAHLADKLTDEVFIEVEKGQRVEQGQLIGYQGNRSELMPQNMMVHLHFAVYDVSVAPQVALDPTPYIGVECKRVGEMFVAGIE